MRDFQLPGRSPVYATNAMCATSHPVAADVALTILKEGGNAMDAAIAAALTLGFCEPQSTGIGGDCFVLFTPPGSQDVRALNGSGRAPMGLDAAQVRASGRSEIGLNDVEAVNIPGAVDAFCRLSEDWGRLGLPAVLAPAIRYARNGVPVAPRVAFDWAGNADRLQGVARDWFLTGGQAPAVGQIWRHEGQAEVLQRIADQGRAGFYEGEVAEDMVASLRALGGTHTLADFEQCACDYSEPISGAYCGHELVEHAPNGQGATAILMAHILSQFDLAKLDPFGAERAHLEIEAAKLAYNARDRFLADADHVTRLDHMLAPKTGAALADLIQPDRVLDLASDPAGAVHRDTVYVSVVDQDRMAVSMIYSTFWSFGSGLSSDKFGIGFQNRGAGFNLTAGHPNEAGGGKRSMHTIIPGMLRHEGQVVMPFGVMGGAYQPNGHIRLLSNLLDYGMDLQEALDAPRTFPDAGQVAVERGYPDEVRATLAQLGHKTSIPSAPLGGGQAIWIDASQGVLIGGSDPRKDGHAVGF